MENKLDLEKNHQSINKMHKLFNKVTKWVKKIIPDKQKYLVRADNHKIRVYGLSKIHKLDLTIKVIINCINSLTHKLKDGSHRNSTHFQKL